MSNVYTKMHLVQKAIAKVGIEKAQRNEHGRYNFRGIDDVQNALAPILAEVGLLVIPSVKTKELVQTQTSGGKATNHWQVEVQFQFVDPDAKEGDHISAVTNFVGEAYDTSDKGLQKAITSAYKYMLFEVFCIPVDGVGDSDADYHEAVAPELMTDDQRHEILGMCMKTNTNVDQFVQWLGFDKLINVPSDQFERAMQALTAKEHKMAKEYAEGEVPHSIEEGGL